MDVTPAKAKPGWPPVVIAGAFFTAVVLMRNLLRRGLSVCCVDSNPRQPGFKTVYGKTFLSPHPDIDPAKWLEFMIGIARKSGQKPVLIPTADVYVTAMAQHAAALSEHYSFCHETVGLQSALATKQQQYGIAEQNGMAIPQTRFLTSLEEITEFARQAMFPCLLKPVYFREWERVPRGHPLYNRKVIFAKSPSELISTYHIVAAVSPRMVAQEVIEGPDTAKLLYLSCYSAQNRERLGACLFRELRTNPIHFGSASVLEPVTDVETDRMCDMFLRRIGYAGLCEIELKRDVRDGRVKMIEANPRYTGSSDAALYTGVELDWLHYLDLIGERLQPVTPSLRDFRHIVLQRDFASFHGYRKEGTLKWRDVLRSYRPPVVFFDLDLRDWRNAADTLIVMTRSMVGPPLRQLLGKSAWPNLRS